MELRKSRKMNLKKKQEKEPNTENQTNGKKKNHKKNLLSTEEKNRDTKAIR